MQSTTLNLRAGPFSISLTTDVPEVISGMRLLYPLSLFLENAQFIDFNIAVRRGSRARVVEWDGNSRDET